MRRVFADTIYWGALIDPRDPWRAAAIGAARALGDAHLVTTQEVLTEVLNLVCGYLHLQKPAVAFVRRLEQREGVEIVPSSRESFADGLALYDARPDKEWNLTDCVSIGSRFHEASFHEH